MLSVSTVATFKWKPAPGYRSAFSSESANVLMRMVKRHYPQPHEFVCVTDDPVGLDPAIRVVPLWDDHATLPPPQGGKNPSCYRRLKVFSREMATVLGPRFVVLDLDTLISADLSPLWDRPEDFVICGDTNKQTPYNGSMVLMTAGARAQVWETFDPVQSPRRAKAAGFFGSDQAWISYCLGTKEATWTKADGVYSFRNHLALNRNRLPDDAKLVIFHGRVDPWHPQATALPWVQAHYR